MVDTKGSTVVSVKRVTAPSEGDNNMDQHGQDVGMNDANVHVNLKEKTAPTPVEENHKSKELQQEEEEEVDGNKRKKRKSSRTTAVSYSGLDSPKRRRRRKKANSDLPPPNESLYLGYVEDGETVDMIMKKFEKLDEIKQQISAESKEETEENADNSESKRSAEGAGAPSGDQALSEDALLKVFQQTSNFTVKSAVKAQHADYDHDFGYDLDAAEGWDMDGITTAENEDGQLMFLFGDGTDDDLWEEILGKKRRKGGKRGSRSRALGETGVTHIAFVSDMHGRFVTGLKKVRKVDPNAIVYTKIPKEITSSWAKKIQPYTPPGAIHKHTEWRDGDVTKSEDTFHCKAEIPENSEHKVVPSILDLDIKAELKARGPCEGIVLSPPWREARLDQTDNVNNLSYGIVPEDLLQLKLDDDQILKTGFVYIWTPKHLILRVLRALEKMGFHYVENAICVKQSVNNSYLCEPSTLFRQSKETLLICRRGTKSKHTGKITWRKVEIRHQRTSDVHFDFIKPDPYNQGAHLLPHAYVHNMVETMLPLGRFNPLSSEENDKENVDKQPEQNAPKEELKKPSTRGNLMHLWAHPETRRTGWFTIAQKTN